MSEGILNPIQQLQADFDFDVYTKQEVDTLLDGKADKVDTYTKTEADALLNGKADKSTTLAGYGITDAYTKAQTDNLLNGKADTNSVYTKEETDNLLSVKANSADVYTKTETDNLLSAKADSVNVYTKTEADTLLAGKASVDDVYTKMEIDNQLTVTKDGTWVKGTQTTATNLEKLEGGIEYLYGLLSYKYSQLRKYINGNYYDYETDTDTAYTKTVPAGAMPYAGIEKIGGKTLVWNQILQNGDFTSTTGWTLSRATMSVSDNVATIACGGIGRFEGAFNDSSIVEPLVTGHKYLLSIEVKSSADVECIVPYYNTDYLSPSSVTATVTSSWTRHSKIVTATVGGAYGTLIGIRTNVNVGVVTLSARNAQITDLTLMFGSGNEPSTVEEFQQTFPAVWYAYNPGSLLSAGVTEIVSKDTNNATLRTYSIPASIQSLEGYGWGAGTVYNYIDFERKVFVQRVGSVDLGSTEATWYYNTAQNFFSCVINGMNSTTTTNAIVQGYTLKSASTGWANMVDYEFGISAGSLRLHNSAYTASEAFKQTLVGKYAYYELATPIETDISAYLTDDNLIEVEAGGTLTFQNQHGDNYRIPVPSEETYMINLQEAVSNG